MRLKMIMLMITVLIFSTYVLTPATGSTGESRAVFLDTKDSDIRELLSNLAKANGINLIIGDSIQGRVTISLRGISAEEAIELILVANGFAMEKIGSSIIAGKPEEVRGSSPRFPKVIALQHASATELTASLSEIAAGRAEVQADSRTNSIVITGTESGVRELEEVIRLLDVDIPAKPEVPRITRTFALKHARASALQMAISELSSPEGKVSMDESTNSLIITDEPSIVERLMEVVTQLDIETPYLAEERAKREEEPPLPPELHTRVFSLNHIDANAIKVVIQEMLSPAGKIHTFVRQEESVPPLQAGVSGTFRGDVSSMASVRGKIEEQKWSDILIVTDVASVVEDISGLIKELDTGALQVKIEAKVVEVNLSGGHDLGINWQAVHSPSDSSVEANFPISKAEGIFFKTSTFTAEKFEDIIVRIQALETRGKAKIMFSPSVITLDNEIAQMLVADKIPITRTYETEFRATTGFEFIDVGISLTVIPHITEDGYIIMDTMPQVDSIKEWTKGENPQPIISSRVAHTRVRVKDGETFALGGLIKDEQNESVSGIPLLSRIPLLGRLFGSKNTANTKTDLMVFITPTIHRNNL